MMSTSMPLASAATLVGVAGVDLLGDEARVLELVGRGLGLGEVVVGHDHLLEPLALGVATLAIWAMDWPTPPVPTMRAFMVCFLLGAPDARRRRYPHAPGAGRGGRRLPPQALVKHIV